MTPNLPDSLTWLPIESIESAGEAECVCISVDHPSRCYVTGQGIVTHNSDTGGAIDKLPPNPKALLEEVLRGHTVDDAARTVGLPPDRAPHILRNIGRALHADWTSHGMDQDTALRELQQRASELPPSAAPKRNPLKMAGNAALDTLQGGLKASAAAARGTGLDKPLGAVTRNRLDTYVSGKVADAIKSTARMKPVEGFTSFLDKIYHDTIPGQLVEKAWTMAKEQFAPRSIQPREVVALMKEREVNQAYGRAKALDIARSVSGKPRFSDLGYPAEHNTPAMKRRLFLAMDSMGQEGHEVALASLPPAMREVAEKLRTIREQVGQRAVAEGVISHDTYLETVDRLPHYYLEDPGTPGLPSIFRSLKNKLMPVQAQRESAWRIEDSQNKDATGQPRLINHDEARGRWRFKSAEHRDAFYDDFIKRQALEHLTSDREVTHLMAAVPRDRKGIVRAELSRLTPDAYDRKELLSEESRGILNQALNRMRQRFTKGRPLSVEEQERAGLIMDPVYATARNVAEMENRIATAHFFNEVAARPDWTTDTQANGFTKIPDEIHFGKLAGKYVEDSIAKDVLEMTQLPDQAAALYDRALNMWKAGHTVWNPGRAVRDILGNFQFSQFAGNNVMNPANHKHYARALEAFRKGGPDLEELYQQGIAGAGFNNAELKNTLAGLLPDARTLEEDPGRLLSLFASLRNQWGRVSDTMHHLYEVKDEVFKAASYFKERELGKSKEEATAHVRKWFPFYDNKGTSFTTKTIKRFIHPFFGFYRESIRIFGHALAERPLALGASLILPYLMSRLSQTALGLTDDDMEQIYKDMRGHGYWFGGKMPLFSVLLPTRSADGRVQQWDISTTMPFADLLGEKMEDQHPVPLLQKMARTVVAGSPFVSLVSNLNSNVDTFRNRPIYQEDMTPAEKAMAQAKYAWSVIAPPYAPGGSMTTLAMHAGERETNKTLAKRDVTQALLRVALGIDVRNASPDLYRMAEDFRKEHKLQQDESWSGASTAQQRLRSELFSQLAQDEPNIERTAKILQALKDSGKPIASSDDIHKLLFFRNPTMIVKGRDAQSQFHYGLSGEAREVLEGALQEYNQIQHRAPSVIAQAKARMLELAK